MSSQKVTSLLRQPIFTRSDDGRYLLGAPTATVLVPATSARSLPPGARTSGLDRRPSGAIPITLGLMHFKLICPTKSQVWDQPANEGFDREEIIRQLDELQAGGHDYEVIDGDAISDDERQTLYGEAFSGLARAGNRYRIRQVFGSRRHGGGDFLGTGVPALIVFNNGEPVDVYPHQIGDGYETIRSYLTALPGGG